MKSLVAVEAAGDERAVRRRAGDDAASRRGARAGGEIGGLGFLTAGLEPGPGLLALQDLAPGGLGRDDLDGSRFLDLQDIGVGGHGGALALEGLPPGLFLFGQFGQALGAELRGQPDDDDDQE